MCPRKFFTLLSRTPGHLWAILLMAACPLARSEEITGVCAGISPPHLTAIEQVLQLTPRGAPTPTIPVETATTELMRSIGGDRPNWNPTNTQWRALEPQVRSDVERIVRRRVANAFEKTGRIVRCDYAQRISELDALEIVSYLESPLGKRHAAFSLSIANAVDQANVARLIGQGSHSQTSLQTAKAVYALLFIPSAFELVLSDPGPLHGRLEGVAVAHQINQRQLLESGAEMSALLGQYETDLPGFRAFLRSPAFRSFAFATVETSIRSDLQTLFMAELVAIEADFAAQKAAWTTALNALQQRP